MSNEIKKPEVMSPKETGRAAMELIQELVAGLNHTPEFTEDLTKPFFNDEPFEQYAKSEVGNSLLAWTKFTLGDSSYFISYEFDRMYEDQERVLSKNSHRGIAITKTDVNNRVSHLYLYSEYTRSFGAKDGKIELDIDGTLHQEHDAINKIREEFSGILTNDTGYNKAFFS